MDYCMIDINEGKELDRLESIVESLIELLNNPF
jgi:hypothetical protein